MRRWNGGGWALAVALVAGLVVTPRLLGARMPVVDALLERVGAFLDDDARVMVVAREQQDQGDTFRWTGRLSAGETVEIKGVNGPVVAVPATGDEVVVIAEKSSNRSDISEVRVEVVEFEGGVTLCAIYPSSRQTNRCESGDSWRTHVQNNDVKVAFRVEVPRGVNLHARTVNGGIEALDLTGDVRAATVNGDVEITTDGFAQAETVNGSIRAVMDRFDPEGAEFETVNGSIELDVPDEVDADLDARWVNGRLETDVPFRVQGRITRRSASGVLGAGGPPLRIQTVNGSIRIR